MTVKTISEAIDSVTEDDIVEDDVVEESTDEVEESVDEEDVSTDEEEEEAVEEEEEAVEETEEVEETEAPPAAKVEDDDNDGDIFDALTAEQIAEIKKNPALNKLRKSLMRGYSEKTAAHSQLVQLGNAYQKDPVGVLHAIAQTLGMEVKPRDQQQEQTPQQQDPGKELEELFGETIGPKVRAVFDKWAEARFGSAITPIKNSLQTVEQERQQARMLAEEAAFKARHKGITPDIEAEVVALGNSGKVVPGRGMTPSEYLDTLYEIVMARRARATTSKVQKTASVKLAKRIAANKRDREPSGISGRGGTVKPVSRVREAKSISEALDIAMAELEAESR